MFHLPSGFSCREKLVRFGLMTLALASGTATLSAIEPSSANRGDVRPNVLLICVDDLRPELRCYGKSYIESPNIDRLAQRGWLFERHYVHAPTCGASRYALLTGRLGPPGNDALFRRAAKIRAGDTVHVSMPQWLRRHGYRTVSVGKVSHHPGGMGGSDWNDPDEYEMPESWDERILPAGPWKHPRGWMHGLANGEIRNVPAEMPIYQSIEGDDSIYPDGPSIDAAVNRLTRLANDSEPFFLAVGILRPHLPFGAPAKYMHSYRDIMLPPIPHPDRPTGKTTWHRSGEAGQYFRFGKQFDDAEFADAMRRHYAACVSYADASVGRLMSALENTSVADDTTVVLWGDHGWHLGEHGVWGKHTLFEESLHSPLIIVPPKSTFSPDMHPSGSRVRELVSTIDVFPTLCELSKIEPPPSLPGSSLVSRDKDPPSRPAAVVAYHRGHRTLRTETHRIILHRDGFVELYDHRADPGETRNVAEEKSEVVGRLRSALNARLTSAMPH